MPSSDVPCSFSHRWDHRHQDRRVKCRCQVRRLVWQKRLLWHGSVARQGATELFDSLSAVVSFPLPWTQTILSWRWNTSCIWGLVQVNLYLTHGIKAKWWLWNRMKKWIMWISLIPSLRSHSWMNLVGLSQYCTSSYLYFKDLCGRLVI